MGTIAETLASVIPIVLLIALGILLRRLRVLDDAVVEGLKRLVVSVVLPAVLFTAFLSMEFRAEYLALIVIIPVACVLLLGMGAVARRALGAPPVATFLFTGFEFGMVGLALYAAAYGLSNVPTAAIVGLGHEFFIWFIFVTLLKRQSDGAVSLSETLASFVKSPVILAIFAGLALNRLGVAETLAANPFSAGVLGALGYLAAVIVPVILLIVGYGTRLSRAGVREAAPLVAVRFVVCLILALVLSELVVGRWLGLDQFAQAAVFMLFILPPPFIVPIFLPAHRRDEVAYSNNVLSLYTVVSVVTFVAYVFATVG
ncbi:transporter [Tessaracoccus sp. MC1627]|uniref:AEC family transporter n=1 Tax=Tessaracoccus sp. MC1627 TaxID=2760312 RepID=UPI0015FFBB5E|nr:transporter [Tessaracoccus sp. MC1627]MBB1512317.1 transporter [Tessaracoccus sp. MC1627]